MRVIFSGPELGIEVAFAYIDVDVNVVLAGTDFEIVVECSDADVGSTDADVCEVVEFAVADVGVDVEFADDDACVDVEFEVSDVGEDV